MSFESLQRVYKISPISKAEDAENYQNGGLHPVHIGDFLKDQRYKILHKLGFGTFSTVWLARDQAEATYVSIKITRADFEPDNNELNVLRFLATSDETHAGRQYIMTLMDDFVLDGPNGRHQVLVTQVAGNRLARPANVTPTSLGAARLLGSQLFQAIEYLHSRNIAHGDLYTGNIVMQLDKFDSWSEKEVYECLGQPMLEGLQRIDSQALGSCAPAYLVSPGNLQGLEARASVPKVLVIDFGQAFYINSPPSRIRCPSQYAAPEILYRAAGLSSAVDKWALGCGMFEICTGYTLFKMLFNPRQEVLKDVVSMLGKPSDALWTLWEERGKYFDTEGNPIKSSDDAIISKPYPLLVRVQDISRLYRNNTPNGVSYDGVFETEELGHLYDLLQRILVYKPDSRISLSEALKHPFLNL